MEKKYMEYVDVQKLLGRWLVLRRDRWHPIPSTLSLLLYSTVVEFWNKYWSKGSPSPGVDLRFCTWLLVFKYWTIGFDRALHSVPMTWVEAFFWPIAVSDICCAKLGPQIKYICIKGLKIPPQLTFLWILYFMTTIYFGPRLLFSYWEEEESGV